MIKSASLLPQSCVQMYSYRQLDEITLIQLWKCIESVNSAVSFSNRYKVTTRITSDPGVRSLQIYMTVLKVCIMFLLQARTRWQLWWVMGVHWGVLEQTEGPRLCKHVLWQAVVDLVEGPSLSVFKYKSIIENIC